MKTIICTLFEGHYHLGAAALINSLHAAGFTGEVVAGYRGTPPPWMEGKSERQWPDSAIRVRTIPLTTKYHLTNYKPDFMLSLLEGETEALWYLDPDIVVATSWTIFEEWLSAGIALCEDVNSPLSRQHPRRVAWRKYFSAKSISLVPRSENYYVNGGCVGLRQEQRSFLETWRTLQLHMAEAIGGLEQSKLGGGTSDRMRDPHFCFNASDQDALNAAIEASPEGTAFSILGSCAMGFSPGAAILPHALGAPKPWKKAYLSEMLRGQPPTTADKAFWSCTRKPLGVFPSCLIFRRQLSLRIAAFLGRFCRRA